METSAPWRFRPEVGRDLGASIDSEEVRIAPHDPPRSEENQENVDLVAKRQKHVQEGHTRSASSWR